MYTVICHILSLSNDEGIFNSVYVKQLCNLIHVTGHKKQVKSNHNNC